LRVAPALVWLAAVGRIAAADSHGSVAIGGNSVITGDGGDHQRGTISAELEPAGWGALGTMVTWQAWDRGHAGLVLGSLVYVAAAARPRLTLELHADLGAELDLPAPAVGGGVRTVVGLVGPLGVALDAGGALVIDGVDRTRLQLGGSAALCVRW
jgi:hypothetical protein